MNFNSSNCTSRLDKLYFTYQKEKPKQIIKKSIGGIYVEINEDGKSEVSTLSKIESQMLNRGEDIVISAPIKLNNYKYVKKITCKNDKNDKNNMEDILIRPK